MCCAYAERERDGLSSLRDRYLFVMRAQKPPSAVVLARAYCVLWPPDPCSRIYYYNTTVDDVSTPPILSPYPPGRPTLLLTNHDIVR